MNEQSWHLFTKQPENRSHIQVKRGLKVYNGFFVSDEGDPFIEFSDGSYYTRRQYRGCFWRYKPTGNGE